MPAALILAVMSVYITHNSDIHTEAVASVGLYGRRASSDTTLPWVHLKSNLAAYRIGI